MSMLHPEHAFVVMNSSTSTTRRRLAISFKRSAIGVARVPFIDVANFALPMTMMLLCFVEVGESFSISSLMSSCFFCFLDKRSRAVFRLP